MSHEAATVARASYNSANLKGVRNLVLSDKRDSVH